MTLYKNSYLLIVIISVVVFILGVGFSFATGEEFFITWKADSYAPYFYKGKILPTNNTNVTVFFELLVGAVVSDLSSTNISWYLDNIFYQSGLGLKTISFKVDPLKREDYLVKISLRKGAKGEILEKTIIIPIVEPETVIDAPYPNKTIPVGVNLLRGLLYFFNIRGVEDVDLEWLIDNQLATEGVKGDILKLSTPTLGSRLSTIKFSAKNKYSDLESATRVVSFIFK